MKKAKIKSRKKVVRRTVKSVHVIPERARDVPITQEMLYCVRDELMSRFHSHDARFVSIEAKLDSYDARFASIEAKLDSYDARFASIEAKLDSYDARFVSIEARLDSYDARFIAIEAKIESLDRKIDAIDAKAEARFQKLSGDIHRIALLVEEQNAKNNIVLDGLTSLFARQDRLEKRVSEIER